MPDANFPACRTPDGRRLAYREFGQPDGRPVFYCHGFPSSGGEAELLHIPARALGLRLIAPDRPGYGGSDDQPGRQISDWPADLSCLADHLHLDRFALIGLSGGGPYALTGAWQLAARLTACTLICALGPVYRAELLRAMHPPARASLALARRWPGLAQRVYGGPTPRILARWPGLVERLRTLGAPAADQAALAEGDHQAILNSTIGDAMARAARGARRDLYLYTHDWQIPFDAIQTSITLWHGNADATVPVAHAHWYQAHLPQLTLNSLPEQGHYSVPIHFAPTILRALQQAIDGASDRQIDIDHD
ncbi:alpha/beta fold hydrolase [Rhabdochromatium marinum]|uniref:alpha/beta fold hydrolase n=1 Tax=Rhabdochromatium marinum TaxID=48729 RepID=UPI001908A95C|nr:alpha/beta hydrolase [Rhabdochromatium marinum]MBK1647856.1 alpha/beta hydrolase [Rhabdochromatium marinum]